VAVYERVWSRYDGALTSVGWRFVVITRFALKEVFTSRVFTAFYAACSLPTLAGLFIVYLSHNVGLLDRLGLTADALAQFVDAMLRYLFLWQALPAFFVTVIVSPSLVAPDLADQGLPLYLSRPITRADYVLGKIGVLAVLLSPMTWLGGLLVFTLQASLEGGGWWLANIRIAVAYVVGHLAWMTVISLLSLAISAWVRHKHAARGTLMVLLVVLGGLAEAVDAVTRSHWGKVLDLVEAIRTVVVALLDPSLGTVMPVWAAWLTLAVVSLGSVWLLHLKLRAHEVVR